MRVFVGTEATVKQKIFSGEYKACGCCLGVFSSGTELIVAELDHVDDKGCVECLLDRSKYLCTRCKEEVIPEPVEPEEPPDEEAEVISELEREREGKEVADV